MITTLRLLKNIGQFHSAANSIPLAKFALIYAENGRGKTTLAAVLRSLSTGDPIPIAERRRLSATNPPHVVCDCTGGPPSARFENGAWNRTLANMHIFDDVFIDANVYSGLAVAPAHRQHLQDLVLGVEGVKLNRRLHELVAAVEAHSNTLRLKAAAIPPVIRAGHNVGDFCALPVHPDIDPAILEAERKVAAASAQNAVRNTAALAPLQLPSFDLGAIEGVLQQDLPVLNASTAARVQAHLADLPHGSERWVADGMTRKSVESATLSCHSL